MKALTSFQKKVYTVVKEIPCGETRSYAWVARKIGRPRAIRAVGTALKKNPFTIIVPCHRVVHSDGSVGNYGPGPDLKVKLLKIEGAYGQGLTLPTLGKGYVRRDKVKIERAGQKA